MKMSFKNCFIVFLVALLGGVVGTFGVIEINKVTGNKIIEEDSKVVLSTVEYPSVEKSNYTTAIEKAYPSVVEITSTKKVQSFFGTSTSYSLGSGVVVSSDGYIVTNNHVVESAIAVSVRLYDGTNYEAKVLGTDPRTDLAVCKIDASNLYFSSFADSDDLILGEETVVIGNPLGEGISCSNGIVSALQKEVTINNYSMTLIQTNAAVNEGNSGGGLFNMNGDLIGIVNAKSSTSGYTSSATIEGMGYAIPSNTVKRIVKDLVDYGYVKERATLGASIYTNTVYSENGIEGIIVAGVLDDSAAQKAGIQQYDIITKLDDNEVKSYTELSKVLDEYEVGDEVEVTLYRGYGTAIEKNNANYKLTEMKLKVILQENVQVEQ